MAKRTTNRRDFLTGRSVRQAVSDLVPEAASASREDIAFLVHVTRRAMGSQFEIVLNAGQQADGPEAVLAALDLVEALEDQMTIYRPHSEVSRINQRASDGPIVVEQRLFALLQQALDLHRETGGAFDITAGPLAAVWGFHRRSGRFPPPEELAAALERVGSQWLSLDADQSTIRFRKPGVEISLNAIGKGYALDRCGELLSERGIGDFMIHGGQSSILAAGARLGSTGTERGWCVAIQHPLKSGRRLAEIRLRDRALGTSGSGQQFFHHQGRRFGHVFDPRTGMSVEAVLSATVLAPTAALADALSTAFFVMGVEATEQYCARHGDTGALLVCPGQRAGSVELHGFGLPESDYRRLDEQP